MLVLICTTIMPSITVRLWWVRVKISIMSISSPSVAHWMCYFVYGACSWLCFAWNLKWNTHTHKKHLKIDQSLIRSQYIFTQPSPEEVRVRIPYRHLLIYVIWYTFRHKVHMVNTLSVSHMHASGCQSSQAWQYSQVTSSLRCIFAWLSVLSIFCLH